MPGIILYMSKHGSTRQYAEWLAEETGFPLIDLKKENRPDLKGKDKVIIGSWILAGRMVAHGWMKKNWSKLEGKKVIVFSVSGDEPNEELRKKYMDASLPEAARGKVSFHSFQGRFRQEDQNIFIRKMLKFAARYENDGDLAKNMVLGVDGVRRENIRGILDDVASQHVH
ncbi:MAG: flavodoxin domain-containing protein [Thermoplasmatota archaeon]